MRPNVHFIMADQFRADAVGCVGGYARTPNLDKLAAKGWLFTSAFANSAEYVPSRISLAVGLYPHQTGVDQNIRCTWVE
nr:sulfatase-like hydrolase/transferase [Armatimonadota bacterium]